MTRTNQALPALAAALLCLVATGRAWAQPADAERALDTEPPQLTLRFGLGFSAADDIGVFTDTQVLDWPAGEGPRIGYGGRAYATAYTRLYYSSGYDAGAQAEIAIRTGGDVVWAYAFAAAGAGGYDEHGDHCGLQLDLFGSDPAEDCDEWHRSSLGISTSIGAAAVVDLGGFNLSLGISGDAILPEHVRGNITLALGGTFDL
jgi:hypothetical protein